MFNNILVPLDGSEVAASILPFVGSLAQRLGSRVTLLTVLDISQRAGTAETQAWAEAQAIIRRQALHLYDMGIEANNSVVPGHPAEEITNQALEGKFSLIAMGTRGHSGLRRGVLGSVTDEVVRTSPVPVLVLSPQALAQSTTEGFGLSTVTAPLDGSPLAESILPIGMELARELALELQLLRVISVSSMAYYAAEGVTLDIAPLEEELEDEATQYLEGVARVAGDQGVSSVSCQILHGSPAPTIVDYLRTTSRNLVVISTHGRSGVGRLLIGSVADSVIRSAHLPVVVTTPEQATEG